MGLLTKAADKAKSKKSEKTTKAKKKSTVWSVGSDEKGEALAESVKTLVELNAKKKAIDAKMGVHKTAVNKHARAEFFNHLAQNGVMPETPMVVQNADGQKVTFVVQDRAHNTSVKPEVRDDLEDILGEDAVEGMIVEETRFAFQREAVLNPEILGVIEKHLESAVGELVEAGLIEDVEDLVDIEQVSAFRPGILAQLPQICGKDSTKIQETFDALGSATVSYVKV